MKKLLLLLLGAQLSVFAQTNVGVEEGRFYMQEDSLDISTNAKRAFDDNMSSTANYFLTPFHLGVVFWNPVRVDSITIHYQSYNGSCGAAVQVSYIELENSSPFTWEADYKPVGTFFASCTGGSITFQNPIASTEGLYFKFTMANGSKPPHFKEFQIWGGDPMITSISELRDKEKVEVAWYNFNGQAVDKETKGFIIVLFSDGSTEKRWNY